MKQTIKILVIEDNPGDARLIDIYLKRTTHTQFYKLTFAETLSLALDQLSKKHYDIAICDLSLPDSHGLDTLKTLQARYPDLPVVVLTGQYDNDAIGVEAVQSGAQDFLSKDMIGLSDGAILARSIRYAVERKRIEKELVREKENAKSYLDIAGVIFLVINKNQKVELINKKGCEILGYTEKEIIGKNWFDLVIPEHENEQVKNAFLQIIKEENSHEYFRNYILTKNGEEKLIGWHNTTLKDENGNITGTLSSGEDITDQVRTEQAIMAAMIEGQEEERKRIAKELHDGLGQILAAINLNFKACEPAIKSLENKEQELFSSTTLLLENAVKEIRNISKNLMPGALEDFGLAKALEKLCQDIANNGKLQLTFHQTGLEQRLDKPVEIGLYRMAQELITNIIKHAKATQADIQLIRHQHSVVFMTEDNGVGFQKSTEEIHEGLGLKNLATRVKALNGTLILDSSEGRGTSVTIEIPLN